MSKKGENIYKRKDGRWEGRYVKLYNADGKAKYGYVYAYSYSEAKEKLIKAKSTLLIVPEKGSSILYSDLLNNWLLLLKINTKESSYARYYQLINSHICPHLGGIKTEDFTNSIIENYLSFLLNNGRKDGKGGLSNKTVSDILVLVKRSFEYAICSGYAVKCRFNKVSIKTTTPDMRVFSLQEQQMLHSYLIRDIDRIKFGILISLYTGIRIGELCALKGENFDVDNGILQIKKTMIRIQNVNSSDGTKTKLVVSDPKSKCSIRDIPIPDFLIELSRQFSTLPSEYILTGESNKFIEPRTLQNHFHKVIDECGIEKANYHALRHTFATRSVELGFEIKSLSEILGHSNVNITLNRYVHPSIELKRNNMQKYDMVVNF